MTMRKWTVFVGSAFMTLAFGGSASAVTRTVCASGCTTTTIQGAINLSTNNDTVQVLSTYTGTSEVFPIQTLIIKGQNPAFKINITGQVDGSGNPISIIKTTGNPDGLIMVSPGVVSNLKFVPKDATFINRVIAAGSGNTCPGPNCHLQGGLTIQNVVIDYTVISGTATPHWRTRAALDLLADNVTIDKVTMKGIAGRDSVGNSSGGLIFVDGNNYTIQNSTFDGRDGAAIRSTLAIGFGADEKVAPGTICSGFPTNYLINNNTIIGFLDGIQWCTGINNTVSNNTITDISGKGIDTSGSMGTQIFGNILQQNTTGATHGIGLSNNVFQICTSNTVRNNKVLGRAGRDMQRGIVVQNCIDNTIFQNEVRNFASDAIFIAPVQTGVTTRTTIQGNTVIGGGKNGIVYLGGDSGATANDNSVIRDNVVNVFDETGIIVQGIKGPRSGAGAGNVVAYNTVRDVNNARLANRHGFDLQNLANTAFDRNTALEVHGTLNVTGYGFFLANSVGVNGNCNTGSSNDGGLLAQTAVSPSYGNVNVNCRVALYTHFDFDGDGKSDIAMYRHTTGHWLIHRSSDNVDQDIAFGQPGSDDIPAPGNYTVPGRTNLAIYRYTTGQWFILEQNGSTTVIQYGAPLVGDVPMPADYDGDGLTDLATFRVSTANAEWHIRRSTDLVDQYVAWGCAACADVGVPGDYDGDGKADVAVYRGSTGAFFVRQSSLVPPDQSCPGACFSQVAWGIPTQGDIPVPGHYTQTLKADMAVYRSLTGQWLIRRSTDFGLTSVTFGSPAAGEFPVPADFTQAGITDIAVYHPTPPTAQFQIRRSTNLTTLIFPYGNPGAQDAPLTAR